MNTLTLNRRAWPGAGAVVAEALSRQRTLTLFALLMLVAMLPAAIALGLDTRTVHGVDVWVKPLKFMAALALFSFSTAWSRYPSHLDPTGPPPAGLPEKTRGRGTRRLPRRSPPRKTQRRPRTRHA